MILAQVDYLGLIGLLAPLALALFGVAYRMGTLSENVRNVRSDVTDMQRDIKEIQRSVNGLPRRRRDVEDD